MTINQALDVSKRSVSYREAEILLGHALGVTREYLYAKPEEDIDDTVYQSFLTRRESNEPIAYITGVKEFYGRPFACDARALIPRPETEGLIDQALTILPERFTRHTKKTNKPCPLRILELGTGCGNIAVTLSLELPVPAEIIATDLSQDALVLAQQNAVHLGAEQIRFVQADLFANEHISKKAPFDLIIANLPYVPSTWQLHPDAQAEVVFREPEMALFGGEDGLDIYRRFFQEAGSYLQADGHILIEFNEDQTETLRRLALVAFPKAKLTFSKDYAELDRTLRIDQAG